MTICHNRKKRICFYLFEKFHCSYIKHNERKFLLQVVGNKVVLCASLSDERGRGS